MRRAPWPLFQGAGEAPSVTGYRDPRGTGITADETRILIAQMKKRFFPSGTETCAGRHPSNIERNASAGTWDECQWKFLRMKGRATKLMPSFFELCVKLAVLVAMLFGIRCVSTGFALRSTARPQDVIQEEFVSSHGAVWTVALLRD